MASGIYTITNKINGKIYVGYASFLYKRLNSHKQELYYNRHINNYLQKEYNKYGKENFVFEELIECSIDFLASEEHYWATILNTHNREFGYNIAPTNPYNVKKMVKESNLKISNSRKGIKYSQETIQRMCIAKQNMTDDTKQKMSNSKKGVPRSEETKNKIRLTMLNKKNGIKKNN